MTRRCPPAILILRQFAHLRALPRSGRMVAVAIAHRCPGSGNKSWRLICQSRDGNCCEKDGDANALTGSASKCHDSLWSGKRDRPIARRVRFSGIGVLNVPVPERPRGLCNQLRMNGLFRRYGNRESDVQFTTEAGLYETYELAGGLSAISASSNRRLPALEA